MSSKDNKSDHPPYGKSFQQAGSRFGGAIQLILEEKIELSCIEDSEVLTRHASSKNYQDRPGIVNLFHLLLLTYNKYRIIYIHIRHYIEDLHLSISCF
jgi:hypothetical protein